MKDKLKMVKYTKILTIWAIFVALASNIWLYLETKDYFKSNHIYFIFSSLVAAIVFYLIIEKINTLLNSNSSKYKIKESLNSIKKTIDGLDEDSRKFELLLFLWRIKVEQNKLENIYSGAWTLKALKNFEYSRYVFGSILKFLDKGDTYITLSNMDFWTADRIGDTDFITMNLEASKKGVLIKRVIIIDANLFINPSSNKNSINSIRIIAEELKRKTMRREEDAKNLHNYFHISKNYSHEARHPVPFALITDKDSKNYMAVLPTSPSKEENPEIKIKLQKVNNQIDYSINKNRFDEIFDDKSSQLLSIDAMLGKIDNLKL